MIIRMRPAPELVFAGKEPEGWTGKVIPEEETGLGYGIQDFFRLRTFRAAFQCVELS